MVAIQTNKINVKINKQVYLGLSDMAIKKIALYKYWYVYSKPEYRENCKLCYMDTDTFIVHVKFEYVYRELAGDFERRVYT